MQEDTKGQRGRRFFWTAGVAILLTLLIVACGNGDGEDRPGIQVIDPKDGSVSVSASVSATGSVSGPGAEVKTGSVSVSGPGVVTATGVAEPGVVQPRPPAARQVTVALKEWEILPEQTQVEAGAVYFLVSNVGPDDPHELVIIRTDMAPGELPVMEGMVPEDQVNMIGEIEPFLPGTAASGVFNLQPGNYLLICNIAEIEDGELESHYELGMSVSFTVTPPATASTGASPQGDGDAVTGGLLIPAGLTAETSGPTKSDGIFTPTTNREIYQKISTDYQEIVALTDLVKQGQPLPAAEIMLLYEAGIHTRIDATSRTLRGFANSAGRSGEFPDSAAYYESDTFLDRPVNDAIRKRGAAEEYTPAQQREAIQKGIERIIYYWAKRYMILGGERLSSRLVDEAWAVYVGEEENGEYPNSLAATARSREVNFGRDGTIDTPLREAMARAQQAADDQDRAAYDTAARDVYSRFNAIFYLGSVRYLKEALQHAEAGNDNAAGAALVAGLYSYMSIQPDVAKASAMTDEAIVAYFELPPAELTVAQRDAALDALNGTASALFLTPDDLVSNFQVDLVPSPAVAASGLLIPAGLTAGGLFIPAGLTAETSGPTKSDGIYTPTTNREIYQKISTDYQEIVTLTNLVKQGQPLPAAEIMLLYEAGTHTRIGPTSRTLRGFARGPGRSTEFPDSAAYYESDTFLDTPVSNAIRKRGAAEEYTPAQRRQAILKGIQRVIYHWAKRYMILGGERLSSRLVDEAWAVYVGEEVNGEYPNSLAATARSREANFGREGTIDIPLREAMARAQQAADDQDQTAYDAAALDVYSRFNAIFYLASVRYMGQALQRAEAGNYDDAGTALVEGLSFYMSIQPDVAKASAAADEAIVAYFESPPAELTAAQRDAALAALNGTASALFLTPEDLVTSFQ